MADRRPLVTPGRIDEIEDSDRAIVSGIVRTAAGDLTFEDLVTGPKTLAQLAAGGGGGEVNTASNVGSGADIFKQKTGVDLEFRGVAGTSDVATSVVGDNVEVSGAALLPLSGSRAMAGALDMGGNPIKGQAYTTISDTFAAQQNDYNATLATTDTLRVTLTGNQSLTGILSPAAGENVRLTIANVDAVDTLTLAHESASSALSSRFACPNGASLAVPPLSSVVVLYDPTASQRWRPIALPAGGGSGEVNTASNVGSGADVFKQKTGVDLEFRGVAGAGSISTVVNVDNVDVDGTALLPRDGSRAMTGALNMATFGLTELGYVTISPTVIAAQQNNYNPAGWNTADIVRLTFTGAQTITGFAAPTAGGSSRKLLINADTADDFTIANESASSTAANRVLTPSGAALSVPFGGSSVISYDSTSTRWRPIANVSSPIADGDPVLSAVRRSTGSANIAAATFIGFDSVLHSTNTAYWTFSGTGTWTCVKTHEAFFDWQFSFVNGSDVNAQVDGECRVSTDGGASWTTVVQAHAGSCYSTTTLKDMISGRAHRNWTSGEQVRFYVVPTLGNFTTIANRTCAQFIWVSG